MKPSQVALAIRQCFEIDRPLFIWGPSGVGKSDSVRQACNDMGVGLIDYRAALRDAVDVIGLPGAKDGKTFYNLPAGLPHNPNWRGVIFLDELPDAERQTQAPMYQLTLDKAVGDYKLPAGARIVAAGNRANDRGLFHKMPDPLINRFIHVDYEAELHDWCTWALSHNILPEVIAFQRLRPELLHNHDVERKCLAFPTPRGWADVSELVRQFAGSPIEGDMIRGRVGDAAAGEFLAFLQLFRNMVSPDQILANPNAAEVPTNASILYALAEALARRATPKNFDAVMTYAKRMPSEYGQCLVSSATLRDKALCNTHEFIAWANANS